MKFPERILSSKIIIEELGGINNLMNCLYTDP